MSMFGGTRRKPSLFDMSPWVADGGGIMNPPFEPGHSYTPPPGQFGVGYGPGGPFDPNAQPAKPHSGGGWQNALGLALGALSDGISMNRGGPAAFQQNLYAGQRAKQQLAQENAQYEHRRAGENQDWTDHQQWLLDHQKPVNNDTANDYEYIKSILGEDAAKSYLTNKTLPPPFVQKNEDGTSTIYPQGIPRAAPKAGPQVGEVHDGYRFKGGDPNSQANWEPIQAAPAPPPQLQPNGLPPGVRPGSPEAAVWLNARTRGANYIPRFSPLDGRR